MPGGLPLQNPITGALGKNVGAEATQQLQHETLGVPPQGTADEFFVPAVNPGGVATGIGTGGPAQHLASCRDHVTGVRDALEVCLCVCENVSVMDSVHV